VAANMREFFILVADDDEDDCLLIRDALAECRINGDLQFVYDGKALMEVLNGNIRTGQAPPLAQLPDLILLDLNMPKKDGREALREIKKDPILRAIPVVILTTSSDSRDVEFCRRLGASSFITKPMIFSEWVTALGSIREYLPAALV